ncbi:hypothetical protein OUZ56_025991 [Daphnia magna]|uniref:Uncharacterized protein n=1 Tax=Daphnia magna TaxID=35525 RepID=A0ABQ9ZLB1_9CRUS|nr:hypothetical protein OUZ56_025991 [Daphnia magna]
MTEIFKIKGALKNPSGGQILSSVYGRSLRFVMKLKSGAFQQDMHCGFILLFTVSARWVDMVIETGQVCPEDGALFCGR